MTRLNEEVVEQIKAAIKAGAHRKHAAAAAGVHHSSIARWMKRGDEALAMEADGQVPSEFDALCGQLVMAIETAEAQHAGLIVADVTAPDAPAAVKLKWLQLRYPDVYGDAVKVKHGLDEQATATLEETMAELGIAFDSKKE